jgi:hypothetical protein
MTGDIFLSADIDPATNNIVGDLKKTALALVRHEFSNNRKLHDDATVAIRNAYDNMGAQALLKQLCTISLVLDALEEKPSFREMAEILTNLFRIGIFKVSGESLDAVTVRRDAMQMVVDGKSTLIGKMNGELLSILSMGKESRETEQQLEAIEGLVRHRNAESIHAVSRAFKIPSHDVEELSILIRNLFDERGNFIRKAFEATLDELTRRGDRVFEILWCYSKVLEGRSNRVGFLNALQHLIGRLNRPKHALRFLLADFCRYPDMVHFSDRNAVMLANILLRTYNKELDVDIEMTPEEVLNVRNGLDKNLRRYAQFRIDTVESRFATKVRTIHEKMIISLNSPTLGKEMMSVHHLLLLEREIFIFLALLSGRTARTILFSALNEYGNPKTGIYRHARSALYYPVLLQHLKIVVRGVGRIGRQDDLELLRQVKDNSLRLAELYGTRENQHALMRTIQWIDNAMRSISTDNRHHS